SRQKQGREVNCRSLVPPTRITDYHASQGDFRRTGQKDTEKAMGNVHHFLPFRFGFVPGLAGWLACSMRARKRRASTSSRLMLGSLKCAARACSSEPPKNTRKTRWNAELPSTWGGRRGE